MADPYAAIAQADEALQARLADVLELRAADPQQRAMLSAYLAEITLPDAAVALEIGCGTGAITRVLPEMAGVREAVGVDPSTVLIGKARELGRSLPHLSFQIADGRALPFADRSFDLVVFHSSVTFPISA